MNKKWGILIALIALVLTGWFSLRQSKEATISSGVSIKATPTPESQPRCTLYSNEEYGFSLCYPADWSLPEEEKITPPQQHLYQITLNPKGISYMVNIYDQPSPISLGSFVRSYFQDIEGGVSWTNEAEINGQEALQFFIPKAGTTPLGIGAVALRKGSYILTISTPAIKGQREEIISDETLLQLVKSFRWLE